MTPLRRRLIADPKLMTETLRELAERYRCSTWTVQAARMAWTEGADHCPACAAHLIHDHGCAKAFARLHPNPEPSRVPPSQHDGLAWVLSR